MLGATRAGIVRVAGRAPEPFALTAPFAPPETLGAATSLGAATWLGAATSRVGAVADRTASAPSFVGTEAGSMSPNSATACSYGMPAAIASTTTERPLAA